MKPLEPPDSFHLMAAEGWLDLGDHREAARELENIKPKLRLHPDVLELNWKIFAQDKNWIRCREIGQALIRAVPERASGWIDLSFALHELQQTEQAFENLLKVASRFPDHPLIPYNLACYTCQLGRLWEAQQWLAQAMKIGDAGKIKAQALQDIDLKPIWNQVEEL
jgi:tetratricopeptide (TPR) repeat protein